MLAYLPKLPACLPPRLPTLFRRVEQYAPHIPAPRQIHVDSFTEEEDDLQQQSQARGASKFGVLAEPADCKQYSRIAPNMMQNIRYPKKTSRQVFELR